LAKCKHKFDDVDGDEKEESQGLKERSEGVFNCLADVLPKRRVGYQLLKVLHCLLRVVGLADRLPASPVVVTTPPQNQFVERIVHGRLRQVGHRASDHRKENDTHGKYIHSVPAIAPLLQHFRRLVLASTYARVVNPRALVPVLAGRKAEVCNLKLVVVAQQQVFWLEVAVNDARRAMEVLDGVKHLGEVVSGVILWEATGIVFELDERKEVALLHQFEHDEKNLDCATRVVHDQFARAVPVLQVDYIVVLNALQKLDFVVENLLERRQRQPLHVVPLYYFYRQKLAAALVLGKLHSKRRTQLATLSSQNDIGQPPPCP